MASCDLPSSSSASSLPITSNPEDGPSAPSATVTKKENIMIKPLNLKLCAEKFSNQEAERNRPRPRIERALEYNNIMFSFFVTVAEGAEGPS